MKTTVNVSVEQKTYELGQGVAKFLGDVKKALADGWNPLTDVPAVLLAAVQDLAPVLGDASAVAGDFADDKTAFATTCALVGAQVVGAALS